jgi:hypothetical protein
LANHTTSKAGSLAHSSSALPFETLIVERHPVRGKFGCHQFLKRSLLLARDRGRRSAYGDIRHAPQPMALVSLHASQ